MTVRVALLHGYSADNVGDGYLVDAAVDMLRRSLHPHSLDLTLFAHKPTSFSSFPGRVVCSLPNLRNAAHLRTELRNLGAYDAVIGVGGGYLRFGGLAESLKAGIVHGTQLRYAARYGGGAIYLPQSIGPLASPTRWWVRRNIRSLLTVYLRDDRSMRDVATSNATRMPDTAALMVAPPRVAETVNDVPVINLRLVKGRTPPQVLDLLGLLQTYDGFIQSTTGNNNDKALMESVGVRTMLDAKTIHSPTTEPRVIVAVRLHAALLAIQAGHFVVHLSYERKGWGAYEDLGIADWVHSVTAFEPGAVVAQVQDLINDVEVRRDYSDRIGGTVEQRRHALDRLLAHIRHSALGSQVS